MVLYSADIMDIAEPVKSVKSRKRKVNDKIMLATTEAPESPKVKKTRKKAIPTPEPESPTPPPTPTPTPVPKKRRLKKAIEKIEPTKVEPVAEKVVEPDEKVVEKAEKVKVEPKPKRVRVKKDPTIAPQWFNKYVESVQKERQQLSETKVPAKQLKIESQEVAKKRWEDGLTRDRVHDEMNNHMGRMVNYFY